MIFAKKEDCFKFYFFMFFFFSGGLGLISAFLNSMELTFTENIFLLFSGINLFIAGLGLLIILIYYFSTRFKKSKRIFSIDVPELGWIYVNFFILSLSFIYFAPSNEIFIVGCYIMSVIILVSFVGIGYWLHDRKTHKKEKLEYLRKAIKNLSTDKPIQEIKKKNLK